MTKKDIIIIRFKKKKIKIKINKKTKENKDKEKSTFLLMTKKAIKIITNFRTSRNLYKF